MCGIAGIVDFRQEASVDRSALETMRDALAHRGPDDAGLWSEGGVGLAHRRLSVIDPTPGGHQPMLSGSGNLALTYNGELYNYREVRRDLEAKGVTFRTACDTEVVAEALGFWGEDALERFNGIFALAAYFRKERRLLLARDRLGVKPLFYTCRRGVLAFASELNALSKAGFADGGMNFGALDAFFTYLYIPGPDTIYAGVQKLAPGELVLAGEGEMRHDRYWDLQFKPDLSWNLNSAAEHFEELLEDAVRLQEASDVPLGAFLSGGMDSSMVVSVLSKLRHRNVKTFSIGFDEQEANELGYARALAEHCGTEHVEETVRPDVVGLLPKMVQHFGEPFADSSALPMWIVSRLARESVTVALSGDGGDELFAGYTWTHRNLQVGFYRKAPPWLRTGAGMALGALPARSWVDRLRAFHADSFLPPLESFRRRLTTLGGGDRRGLYTPETQACVVRDAVDRYGAHAAAASSLDPGNAMLSLDTAMYLPGDILTKVDRMSMAHGLEARVPLLDHRIVEFAATLPFSLKYRWGISKRVAKHAFRASLPPEIMRQRKRGFAVPLQRWFRGALADHFQEVVLAGDARSRAYLRPEYAENLLREHVSGRRNLGHPLWCLLVFEHWLHL